MRFTLQNDVTGYADYSLVPLSQDLIKRCHEGAQPPLVARWKMCVTPRLCENTFAIVYTGYFHRGSYCVLCHDSIWSLFINNLVSSLISFIFSKTANKTKRNKMCQYNRVWAVSSRRPRGDDGWVMAAPNRGLQTCYFSCHLTALWVLV